MAEVTHLASLDVGRLRGFFRFPRPGAPRQSEVRAQHSPMIAARSAILWLRVAESPIL